MEVIAESVGFALKKNQYVLSTAESCTGGLVAKLITDIAGYTDIFPFVHHMKKK